MHLINPLPFKPPRLIGMSETLTADHYQAAYGRDVQQLNELLGRIEQIDCLAADSIELRALQTERTNLTNAVVLHEVYFDSLGGQDGLGSPAVTPAGELEAAINQSFGDYTQWQQQFVALANATASPGWLVMNWSEQGNGLSLQMIRHNEGVTVGSLPIMGIDLFEHAYEADFGTDRSAYIDAFMKNLHWDRPLNRFRRVTRPAIDDVANDDSELMTPETLTTMINDGAAVHVLDVCLTDDIPNRYDTLPNARFVHAEAIDDWIQSIPEDTPIVAYCMYGFQVSANAVKALQQHGFAAKKLAGGIASWRALGLPTQPLKR